MSELVPPLQEIEHWPTPKERLGKRMEIGVVLPLSGTALREPSNPDPILELAQEAERIGADAIWVNDHPELDSLDCWTTLAYIACATKRPMFGPLVSVAPTHLPLVTVRMANTLGTLSDNRLVLGLGAGTSAQQLDNLGVPSDHRASRFEEYLKVVVPSLRQEVVNFSGKYYTANYTAQHFRPEDARPPILVGAYNQRMMRLAAEWADWWNTDRLRSHGVQKTLPQKLGNLMIACAQVGREPSTLEITGGLTVVPEPGDPPLLPEYDQPVTGSPKTIAKTLRDYEKLGLRQVMCTVYPPTKQTYAQFGEGVKEFRAMPPLY